MTGRPLRLLVPFGAAFFLFAVLLNSVGPVILQSIQSFGVSKADASLLEGFKDLPIAAASFLVGSLLPRIGYRRGTVIALAAVGLSCAVTPLVGAFWVLKLQFAVVGMAFAAVKTAIYVIVGLVAGDARTHASVTNTLEAVFTLGVLSSFWLFSLFIDPRAPGSTGWLRVYPWLAGAAAIIALAVALSPLDERAARPADSHVAERAASMPLLLREPFVLAFLAAAFLDVLVEQSINTWLPTLNREVLGLSSTLAVQLASLYAVGLAAGRLGCAPLLRRVGWARVLAIGVMAAGVLMGAVVLVMRPAPAGLAARWRDLPPTAYALPAVGLLLAPVYPTLCSAVLSALVPARHPAMTALILISSALGGTLGSAITGRVFAVLSGRVAFLAIVAPMLGLLLAALAFDAALRRAPPSRPEPEPAHA